MDCALSDREYGYGYGTGTGDGAGYVRGDGGPTLYSGYEYGVGHNDGKGIYRVFSSSEGVGYGPGPVYAGSGNIKMIGSGRGSACGASDDDGCMERAPD